MCERPQDHLPWWESVDNASNCKTKYSNIRMPFIYVEVRLKDPVQRVENICLQGRKMGEEMETANYFLLKPWGQVYKTLK